MQRLLVLNGGAKIKADRSGVMLRVEDPRTLFEQRGINTGDLLVYDAIVKQLRFSSVGDIGFEVAAKVSRWPKEAPDATIIRGSNYVSAGLDLGEVVPLLRHLKGPIVALGVGAQAATYDPPEIPAGSVAFWREVAGKCVSIGVRGAYSAEIFEAMGIRNLRIIGCPSFYRSLRPELRIRPADPESARIGLTLNKHLSGPYCSNRHKTIRLQRALIAAAARRPGSHVFSQGEAEESLMPLVSPVRRAQLLARILASFGLAEDAAAAALLQHAMSANLDVDAWAAEVAARIDFMMGFRVHGTAIALQQGLPGVYFTYDSRIREMAALFRVPSIEIEEFRPVDPRQIIAAADFAPFERAYRENYAEYLRFLDENGLEHRLPPALPGAVPAEPPGLAPPLLPQRFAPEVEAAWYRGEWEALSQAHDTALAQLDARYIRRGRA